MTYQILIAEIESDVKSTQDRLNGVPCPVDCFQCCTDTSTMTQISGVEAQYLQVGLRQLNMDTRKQIYDKAVATIELLEAKGWTQDTIADDRGLAALEAIRGETEAECPMLIDGRCAVYEHRPMICRAWGYPIILQGELNCCDKVIIHNDKSNFKPIYYPYYEQQCDELSQYTEIQTRIPNAYLVKHLIDAIQRTSEKEG